MKEAAEFAESTQILMNVSEFTDISTATDTLISAVQAFGYTAETSMEVVDLMNIIGNNYAISTADLATSLTKSSASLVAAGGNLAEAAALTATANAIIQDADSVGTALKTTSLRLRGTSVKVLEEEGLDSDGAIESTSKLRSQVLATSGVDILTDTGAYKSTYQILLEIAEVWDQITDDKARAGLLELLAGKRNSSVIAALLQNPEDLKAAYEDAMDAEGSALKENERYLDSIQGKIDQFNNALQAMWSDTLDSDVVKWFVNLGTELIRIVDTLGLIPSILLSIASFKILQSLFKGADIVGFIKSIGALTMGTKVFEAETRKAAFALMGETINTKLAGSALVDYAVKMKLAEAADISKMTTTQLLGLSFQALGVAIWNATKAIVAFLFTNHVGWIILAIGAIAGGIAIFNHFHKTTEELTEELGDLKKELQDVQSEMETVNSELETMEDRMAELLAKDSLSFVEQEELDRLQKENNELQRRLDLLEAEEKIKQDKAAETFVQTMESYGDKTYKRGEEMNWWQRLWSGDSAYAESQDEYIDKLMSEYDKVLKVDSGELDRSALIDEMDANWYSEKIGAEVQALVDAADGLDYYIGDNLTDQQKEVNEWLDYVYNTQDKLAIMRGGKNAKTNALNRIFDKDENAEISDSIDEYVEALKKGDTSAKTSIENIIKNNKALVEDLENSGLSAGVAVDYFTSFASELEFATLEGKIAEMQNATSKIQTLLSDTKSVDFTGLFDKDGEVSVTAIAEYFQGTSQATREEIAKLVKDINDGEISVENALKQFEIFSIQSSLDIYITEVQTNFKDVFVDLEDADGLISTFEELGEAIGSAANALDTLNQAQAEMAYSGHVSIETALQLMEYTDDYGSILQVVDGKLQLVEGAEENLIQARINAIKTSAEASLSDATNAYNKAVLATQEYKSALTTDMSAEVVAKSWEKVLAAGAGLWEGIKSLITDESWSDAYNRGYNETLSSITGYETEYNDSGLQALADAEAEAKALMEQAQDRVELANQLTPETLESINSSEAASGGADDPEEVAENAFQKAMDYWENRIGVEQSRYQQIQNEIDLLEAKGKTAGFDYYKAQIASEENRLNLLRQQQEEIKKYVGYTDDAGNKIAGIFAEGSDEWWEAANKFNDIENEIDGAILSVQNLKNEMKEVSHSLVDDIQSVYDTLLEAEKEYAENGYISVDTLQSLLELEPKYLDMLVNENGELVINEQTLQEVAKARVLDMGIKQQSAILENALSLATKGSTQEILNEIAIMEVAQSVGADWIEVQLDMIQAALALRVANDELTQEQSDAFINGIKGQVRAVGDVTQIAIDNMANAISSSASDAEDDAFQKMMEYWENRIQANQAKYQQIQNEIDLLESKSKHAGVDYYQKQIQLEEERRKLLESQKTDAQAYLDTLEEGSEAWWEVAHTLNDIENDIDDVTASMVDLQDAIGEIDTYKFEEFNKRLDDIASKLGTIRDLIAPDGAEDWFDDEGNWTEEGVAVLGSYVQELETYRNGLSGTEDELAKYSEAYSEATEAYYAAMGIHSEQEWYDKTDALIDQQYEFAKSISDTERSIVDMYESSVDAIAEYMDTLIDGYNDYIDSVKEALDAERDLYDFKKKVQNESKNIAELERKISSLSGSTNASDIASRRKLEAELFEARESLNDSYREHALSSQQDALDQEAQAYEESMNNMIEDLRTSLEEATSNMDEFLMGVTSMVMYNADTVLQKYQETNLPLTTELTNPWEQAKAAVGDYSDNALDLMNEWTKEDGFFAQFNSTGTTHLTSPWTAGSTAANDFASSVKTTMSNVVSDINTNVLAASEDLKTLDADIKDTNTKIGNLKTYASDTISSITTQVGEAQSDIDSLDDDLRDADKTPQINPDPVKTIDKSLPPAPEQTKNYRANAKLKVGTKTLSASGTGSTEAEAKKNAESNMSTAYYNYQRSQGSNDDVIYKLWTRQKSKIEYNTAQAVAYAKGTTSTPRDEWAITDEPQFGDELVLVPGKDGNLSFMRKGTGVVPADLTANLMEWGQFTPDSMKLGGSINVNMINNAVNKPEFNFAFDALVKAENITEETLPAVKKLVTQELNRFTKELNYALKGKGAR